MASLFYSISIPMQPMFKPDVMRLQVNSNYDVLFSVMINNAIKHVIKLLHELE